MHTPICDRLGCDVPIFAFSHCRDVVAEVVRAGGFGVLGASTFSPEQLEVELSWLDSHTSGRRYGVDVVIPAGYERGAENGPAELESLIPPDHREFQEAILRAAGVPGLDDEDKAALRRELAAGRGGMTPDGARRLLRVALGHSRVAMVVSALGTPPPDVVADVKVHGAVLGALCGKPQHARRQVAAGVEVVIAQGTEAGGHTGDIATMVLVPEVVRAVGSETTVLAAGGIAHGSQIAAAFALGAAGVWCGTLWLATVESELGDFEKAVLIDTPSEGTVRSRARTGKTVRMIRSELSDAWDGPGAPPVLPTPLQGVLYNEAHARVVKAGRRELYSAPAGQVVGSIDRVSTVREVMFRLQSEYLETMERLMEMVGK